MNAYIYNFILLQNNEGTLVFHKDDNDASDLDAGNELNISASCPKSMTT